MPSFINLWAIAASMVLSVILGFIWYGPLFGKKWMALSEIAMPAEKPGMGMMIRPIILSLIGAFFMVFTLSSVIAFHDAYYTTSGYAAALSIGFLLWLGFSMPAFLNFTGWEGKPWALFGINSGYWLVYILLSSALIVLIG